MSKDTMKQAVVIEPGNIQVEEAPIPKPGPGELLIKVHNLGLCGSDIHAYAGEHAGPVYPFISGHEMSGEIADANGSSVYKNGDKVIVIPQTFCGECDVCKAGNNHWCMALRIPGVMVPGMAREYVAFPERMILRVPEDMPYEVAAAIEPLAVAVHSCVKAGDLTGKNVLVLGAGVIGNFAAQAAKLKGAGKVVLAGRREFRMDFARQVGIEDLINTDDQDPTEGVLAHFGGLPDVVLDFIGVGDSVNVALAHCRKGGVVVLSGIYGDPVPVDLGMIQHNEINLVGTMMYTVDEFNWCIKAAHEKKLLVEPLVTSHFTLDTFNEAYAYIAAKDTPFMKVMIDIA